MNMANRLFMILKFKRLKGAAKVLQALAAPIPVNGHGTKVPNNHNDFLAYPSVHIDEMAA